MTTSYEQFIKNKVCTAGLSGFDVEIDEINPILRDHQKACVRWAVRGGQRALFESFGLGKSVQQLEILRIILKKLGGGGRRGLIVAPLGVRQEFKRDASMLGLEINFVRRSEEVSPAGLYITNYESVRDGKLNPHLFDAVSLDEASVLRGFGGTKTFREFMALFAGDRKTLSERTFSQGVQYRFVATATPSPNEYIELLAYAAFLGIMDVSAAKTRFFKRDSTKADNLTIHPHKVEEFWLWVASWAMFLQRPSDLGFSDDGYALPEKKIFFHEVRVNHLTALPERDGQGKLFREATTGVVEAAREKRDTLADRIAKMQEILAQAPDDHFLIWHDLEAEREAIEKTLPEAVSVYGAQDLDEREQAIIDFSDGKFKYLAAKPVIAGSGCNFQRHCHKAIFLGIGYKFNDFIQAIHRIHRFLQTKAVEIHIIYAESEKLILESLLEKWERDAEQRRVMAEIIKKYGLSHEALAGAMTRSFGVERVEIKSENYTLVNNDCVLETRRMAENSVGLILTSIPFSTQYEYSPNYNDFGHTDTNEHFFAQMDFLTPELLRVLQPGRIAAIHVKDRIVPGGMTGLGFQTVYPFHCRTIEHYTRHGFAYMGMKTIVTDVVRENNQTYRLGWTEQCKDGTKMGVGMPEYLLLFRKPPTDNTDSYADLPVVKSKEKYSRSRWQVDAHGFARSSGNRLLAPEDLKGLPHDLIFKLFRDYSREQIYDFENHVRLGEALEAEKRLPMSFMLLQPQSWSDEVWTDITRMLTLNGSQYAKGKQMHLCLARGSLVLTYDGYKPIEDLSVGELVLTHEGRWRPITAKACIGTRQTVKVTAQGVADLRATPDHKLWTRKGDKHHPRKTMQKCPPEWVEANETLGQYLNLKLPPVQESFLTAKDWWIVGRYLADGHQGFRGNFIISVGNHKLRDFLNIVGENAGVKSNDGTVTQIVLKGLSANLKTMLRRCGKGASGKVVPGEAICLNQDLSESLLSGYLSGDGYLDELGRWHATSVSRPLLLGMALVAQRARNTVASVYAGRDAGQAVIEGRTVVTRDEWKLMISPKNRSAILLKDGAWKKVRSIEDAGETEVWDISVAEDASFTAEGCVVKNCPMQFDLADRVIEQFSMPGEVVFDPFAGLGTVPYRAVLKRRKGYGVELSHPYFLDAAAYLKAAEDEISVPTLFDLLAA
jgi:DNA modification methylase